MKNPVKKIIYIAILILILFIVVPPISYKKLANPNKLPDNIVKGVFHVHSNFSDGKGDIGEISEAAAFHNLDFVILADHGEPNLECVYSTAYHRNVLLIGGSEFSLDCGHLASAGFGIEKYRVPPEPQEAVNYVNRYRGFSFISHPLDKKIPWKDWNLTDYTGIEVLSSYSSARRISIPRLFAFPFRYILNHKYALLGSLDYPEENLKTWDKLNSKGNYLSIYALDAHARIPVTKKIFLNFPSYKAIFSTLTIYIKIPRPLPEDPSAASAAIVDSIRRGKYFNVIEAIAPANGFNISFRSSKGTVHDTGEMIGESRGSIILDLPFNFPVRVLVRRDGNEYFTKKFGPFTTAEIPLIRPGVYRCEVFSDRGSFKKLPWILSNPFFISTGNRKDVRKVIVSEEQPLFNETDPFHIEKNTSSSGSLINAGTEAHSESVTMDYILKGIPGERDHWVSLASRKKISLSGFRGISFRSRSTEEMTYWLEIRTGGPENGYWYRHSFLSGTEWQNYHIPFDRLHQISKNRIKKDINLSDISSFFFSINNSMTTIPEISGRLEISDLKVYK